MIAFKTYSICPPSIRDQDAFDEMPWEVHEIGEDKKEAFEELGFTVLTSSEYSSYLTSISEILNQYNQIKTAKNQASRLDQYLEGILSNNQNNGLKLIIKFGKRNLINRKTEDEIDAMLEDLDVIKLSIALISGSYKYALRKVDKINNPAINQEDKDFFKTEISALL